MELIDDCLADSDLTMRDIKAVLAVGGTSNVPLIQNTLKEFFNCPLIPNKNPTESVVLGAAIQAGILEGSVLKKVLVDVTPLSLGIEIEGGFSVPIIERNSPIPISRSRLFTTITENQKAVEVHILQGESNKAKENVSLGRFFLNDIRAIAKGEPRIEVTFTIDLDGIIRVSAKDIDTDKICHITLGRMNQ